MKMTTEQLRQAITNEGKAWKETRELERQQARRMHALFQAAAGTEISESEMSRLANVDRMTVRRALGKR
jgi:hypothetical protein